MSRLQHLIADHADILLSIDSTRITISYWDFWNRKAWINGTSQFVYSYASSTHVLINQATSLLFVLCRNQNISMVDDAVRIYTNDLTLAWHNLSMKSTKKEETIYMWHLHNNYNVDTSIFY